jgi:hypothetical protein
MAKKTNDLKITDKQLEKLQEKVRALQGLQNQIGGLEVSKMRTFQQMDNVQAELSVMQTNLEEEYGKVSINIMDGTISELPKEDEVDKKD